MTVVWQSETVPKAAGLKAAKPMLSIGLKPKKPFGLKLTAKKPSKASSVAVFAQPAEPKPLQPLPLGGEHATDGGSPPAPTPPVAESKKPGVLLGSLAPA